jgi:hypothetical protein
MCMYCMYVHVCACMLCVCLVRPAQLGWSRAAGGRLGWLEAGPTHDVVVVELLQKPRDPMGRAHVVIQRQDVLAHRLG